MIEPIMYVGLGFLAASLLALVIIPLVHDRAVRLTLRRINAAMPSWPKRPPRSLPSGYTTERCETSCTPPNSF